MQPEPGIPHARTVERARRISDTRYALHLHLPAERRMPIAGHVTITFMLRDATSPLTIDFAAAGHAQVSHLVVNGFASAPGARPAPHLVIDAEHLRHGANTVTLAFTAGDAPLNRRDDLLYSIFVPARAHEAFPCFDQPDLKARWTLTLDTPAAWRVVSNGDVVSTAPHTDASGEARLVTRFTETLPLPTYLFAFAAGNFQVHEGTRDGRPMRLWHGGAEPALLDANSAVIFDRHAEALRWLERYTGIPYPFDAFDIVLLPAFQFSGMEHPGAIFYNAATLLLSPTATRQQDLARASVIAHETAHLWFGDLVTMRWFDDVWMKEVCANFMAARIVSPPSSELDRELQFLHAHYPGAYDVDRTAGTHPIRQPLDNLADAGSLYGAIIYLKSPIVLRQLELRIGEDALREAFREYLTRYAFGNASWPDLIDLLAARGVPDIQDWSRAWIDDAGRPAISVELSTDGTRVSRASVRGHGTRRAQRLDVAIGRSGTVEHARLWFAADAEVPTLAGRALPDYVLPNGHGLGYGHFRLDAHSRNWLLAHLQDVPDALTRASAWLTLWDAMLEGDTGADVLLATALAALDAEDHELNLQRLLSCVERLFWIFTDSRQDTDACQALEARLCDLLSRYERPSLKAAVFNTLRAVTTTVDGLAWLRALRAGDSSIPGLTLGDAERAALALELAVRTPADAGSLSEVMAATADPERRGFLEYVAPALSHDAAIRQRFVTGLADAANRRREPWVIEALRWLHHPLLEYRSLEYLRPGLDLLDDVRRTGDIFLPKRWLDAMLSGHRSPAAALVVRRFLASYPPHAPDALRRMVLASADPLFRAAAHMQP